MIKEAIVKIVNKEDLTYDEAYSVMNEIMDGKTSPTQNAAFLASLSTKSAKAETTDEKYKEGVKLIYDSFMGTMDKLGVEKVQTGVAMADIVYETELEGGITSMMAVFKDISKVGQVGCIRSARYAYVDLAAGHDALYVHCGLDYIYCNAHFNELNSDHVDINTGVAGKFGFREKNGLAYEHTMYTTGAKLLAAQSEMKRRTTTEKNSWLNFAEYDEEAPVVPSTTAQKVHIKFSGSASNAFTYNETTGKYERTKNGSFLTDYKTGERVAFKNIFVLNTTMGYYSDGHHRNISLTGGDGYYIVNGKYEAIKWKKGSANTSISITKADGTTFTAQPGNSWVCIVNKATTKVTYTAAPVPETSSVATKPAK